MGPKKGKHLSFLNFSGGKPALTFLNFLGLGDRGGKINPNTPLSPPPRKLLQANPPTPLRKPTAQCPQEYRGEGRTGFREIFWGPSGGEEGERERGREGGGGGRERERERDIYIYIYACRTVVFGTAFFEKTDPFGVHPRAGSGPTLFRTTKAGISEEKCGNNKKGQKSRIAHPMGQERSFVETHTHTELWISARVGWARSQSDGSCPY